MIIEFLTHEANTPYLFSLAILVVFFAFEIIGMLIGMSISHTLDSAIDFDIDTDMGGHLSLLGFGKVPLMVWLMFFLGIFTILGYGTNTLMSSVFGGFVPVYVLIVPVLALTIYMNTIACSLFAKLVPRHESDAVDADSFEGRVARVTVGVATKKDFAMGTVLDVHGNSHNIRILAMDDDSTFNKGLDVILVERISDSNLWNAIPYKK